jgi:hypothetical protein
MRRHHAAITIVAFASTALAQPEAEKKPERTGESAFSIAEDPHFRIRIGGWFTSMDGHVSVGSVIPGTVGEIDFQDTLGLPSDKTVFSGSIGVDLGERQLWHIDVGYAGPFRYDGDSGNINISFDNLNYTGSVHSHVSTDVFEITALYDLTKPDPVILSLGAGTRIFNFKGSITGTATDPSTGATQVHTSSADAVVAIPGLAAAVRWDITDRFHIRGQAQGLYVGRYGNLFDADAELGFDFTANLGLYAGYRWLHGQADVSDVNFNLNLRGPFVGVEARF